MWGSQAWGCGNRGRRPQRVWLWRPVVWLQDFHRTGGNRNSSLGGCTQGLGCTRAQGKKRWPHKWLGQTYLLVLEGPLRRSGSGAAVAHCGDRDTRGGGSGNCSLAWALKDAAFFPPRPGPTQRPVGTSAGTPQAKQPTGREHSPTHQQRLFKVFLKKQLPHNKHTHRHCPAHQWDKTQLHPSVGGYQSFPPANLHKPLSLIHQGADSRRQKNYNPAACKTETTITES